VGPSLPARGFVCLLLAFRAPSCAPTAACLGWRLGASGWDTPGGFDPPQPGVMGLKAARGPRKGGGASAMSVCGLRHASAGTHVVMRRPSSSCLDCIAHVGFARPGKIHCNGKHPNKGHYNANHTRSDGSGGLLAPNTSGSSAGVPFRVLPVAVRQQKEPVSPYGNRVHSSLTEAPLTVPYSTLSIVPPTVPLCRVQFGNKKNQSPSFCDRVLWRSINEDSISQAAAALL
jgi:hypothetical protein